jgi:hypothetical protein
MTPREMKLKLEALKPKLEGRAEPFGAVPEGMQGGASRGLWGQWRPPGQSELTDVVKGLLEVIEAMLAEQAAERVRKGGF